MEERSFMLVGIAEEDSNCFLDCCSTRDTCSRRRKKRLLVAEKLVENEGGQLPLENQGNLLVRFIDDIDNLEDLDATKHSS